MKKFIAVGYPDEENIYHHSHVSQEKWTVYAETREEALRAAFNHFYYFHEVGVFEAK